MRHDVILVSALLAGCPSGVERTSLETGGAAGQDSGGGAGATPTECRIASDCAPAGPRCCDCPTHAVPAADPAQLACMEVTCAPSDCGSPMQADCVNGQCVLACAPVACGADVACPAGFAVDDNGCLTCACAVADQGPAACTLDAECARVHADCCGCAGGGMDTSVPTSEVAAHDASLACPANPSCPGPDACSPDLAARCVQGRCELVDGALPAGACGRDGLAACPDGTTCTVNASDRATMYGVGICLP